MIFRKTGQHILKCRPYDILCLGKSQAQLDLTNISATLLHRHHSTAQLKLAPVMGGGTDSRKGPTLREACNLGERAWAQHSSWPSTVLWVQEKIHGLPGDTHRTYRGRQGKYQYSFHMPNSVSLNRVSIPFTLHEEIHC